MSTFLDPKVGFENLKLLEGICIGIIFSLMVCMIYPAPEPIIKTVEKQTVLNVPVYLDNNALNQIECMADNAYFEARNQSTIGKIAVTNVVMNRVSAGIFPSTPCEVISQRNKKGCQFSWVCDHHSKVIMYNKTDSDAYKESKWVAEQVYIKNIGDITYGATYYHTDYVAPAWAYIMDRTTKIGKHIFYRK